MFLQKYNFFQNKPYNECNKIICRELKGIAIRDGTGTVAG